MKSTTILSLLFLTLFLGTSCNSYLYPLGDTAKKAYKETQKEKGKRMKKMTPVQLDLDSIQAQQWVAPSPNFNFRTPNLVVIHYTAQKSCEQSLKTLSNPNAKGPVSAHYLVCKDGSVYQQVDELYRAWHGGIGRWGNINNINSVSLGIELDNDGHEPFSEAQIRSLLVLLKSMKDRYHIPEKNFVGHADIAPTRKPDPGVYFPWDTLAQKGFGVVADSILVETPEHFNSKAALRLIGYDVRDEAAAIIAFKRHFVQTNIKPKLDSSDQQILYNIYQKFLND